MRTFFPMFDKGVVRRTQVSLSFMCIAHPKSTAHPPTDSHPVLSCVKTSRQLRPGPQTPLELDLQSKDLMAKPPV